MRRGMTRRDFLQEAALATAVLGLGGDLLSACGGAASGSQAAPPALKRDSLTLVYAVDNFTPDFDPASYYVNSPAHLTRSMYEGLLSMKPGSVSETQPALATSYKSTPDYTSWTFTIRQGVTFWDGTPLDAATIKAAYVRSIGLALGAGSVIGTFVSDPQKQIVVVDPATLRFDLGQPVSYFNLVVASIWGTGVASPKVMDHSTGSSDQGHQWLQSNAAGTGPYMLQSVEPGNQAVLVQNPSYWGGWKPNQFKKVIIQQIPDGSSRREALQTGAIDMAVNSENAQDTVALLGDHRFNVASCSASTGRWPPRRRGRLSTTFTRARRM
jgi:peptide/nickel transport system substrate-binding protein